MVTIRTIRPPENHFRKMKLLFRTDVTTKIYEQHHNIYLYEWFFCGDFISLKLLGWIFSVSDRRRLNDYGGFVMTFRDWQDSMKAIKDLVLTHRLSSVVLDIKGEYVTLLLIKIKCSSTSSSTIDKCILLSPDVHVQCHESCPYEKDILQCFETIPWVELLKIVVSEDMFHVINPTNSGI